MSRRKFFRSGLIKFLKLLLCFFQLFSLTKTGEFRREFTCSKAEKKPNSPNFNAVLVPCSEKSSSLKWVFTEV